MSVSYYVKGVIEPDKRFESMKKIWILCEENGISIPEEVIEYFDGENPSLQIEMERDIDFAVEELRYDTTVAYKVDLKILPEHIRYIKFCCDY